MSRHRLWLPAASLPVAADPPKKPARYAKGFKRTVSVSQDVGLLIGALLSPLTHSCGRPDGRKPVYAFVYPNFMINRYSLWTGTMLVNPTGPDTCTVYMDYWVDPSKASFSQALGNPITP